VELVDKQLDLTDQQWHLLEALFNDDSSHSSRGRPPLNPRPLLDAILWKIRHAASWENLPSCYPSHITCYRRYRIWSRDGRLEQAFLSLYEDLLHRGRFDLQRALREGTVSVTYDAHRYHILVSAGLIDTWQLSTALVFIQLAIIRLKKIGSNTLTTKFPNLISKGSPAT